MPSRFANVGPHRFNLQSFEPATF